MNIKTRYDIKNIQEVAGVTQAPTDLRVNTELLLETVPLLMGITGGSPAVNVVAECWGQRQSLCHVLRAAAILSRSPVVHGYKSHHQLSEHPQPASSSPDWWWNGGKNQWLPLLLHRKSHLCLVFWFDVLPLRRGKLKAEFEQADRRQWEEVSRVNTTAGFNLPSFPVEVMGSPLEKKPF